MNNKNKQKGKNVNTTTSRPIRARGKAKRIRQDDEKVPEERGQDRNNPTRGHRRNVSRNEARFKVKIEKEKEIMKIVIDERPKLFVFETEDEDIEINAMDFKDACITLEEQAPDLKIQDIISIQEIHSPIPGHDTIH
tara:strand:+ start:5127 stop:5537 length:411 start_codon:yes stop_codon:yes gene_type:complete